MKELLKVRDLKVSYFTSNGVVQSVRGVDFSIEEGKTTAIVGESGCGKSVTAKAVMGLIKKPGKILEGSSIIFEEELCDYSKDEWNKFRGEKCAMIFQDALTSLNPTMQVGKQLIEVLKNHDEKMSKSEMLHKAEEILSAVGIPDAKKNLKKYPHELSGGMRQRVMIAMAMILGPRLLIADEPTTALDVTIQAQIIGLMKELQVKTNMSIILITHDLGVVADIADEIIVMYAGKIVEKGSCDEIFFNPKHPYTWALLKAVPSIDAESKKELTMIEGSIPDMTNPPLGCGFCNRCPYIMEICKDEMPPMTMLEGHSIACWLSDERADRSGIPFWGGVQDGQ